MDYLTDEQQTAMLLEAKEAAEILAPVFGYDDEDFIKLEPGEDYDPMLNIGGVFQICAYMESNPNTISSDPKPRFLVGHTTYHSGVMYYPDGSGEPPSEDFEEDETDISNAKSAVVTAFRMYALFRFNQALEIYEEQQMSEKMENAEW